MNPKRLLLTAAILTAGAVRAGDEPEIVPVYEEPYHRLVFEKDGVRIFSTSIPPGDTSRFHRHENPTLYVVLGFSKMRNQELGEEWTMPDPDRGAPPPGAILFRNYAEEPQDHRVDNIGTGLFQVVGVIHYGAGGRGTPALADKTEVGNQWFDGYRYRLAAGENSPVHTHDNPVYIVQVSGGQSHVIEHGNPTSAKTVKGNWSWHEAGVEHRLKNSGDSEVELVEMEIKQP